MNLPERHFGFSCFCGLLAATLAVWRLGVGFAAGEQLFPQLTPFFAGLKPNLAVAVVFLALGLCASTATAPSRKALYLVRLMAFTGMAIGVLTLLEIVFSHSFGIDTVLMADPFARGSGVAAGRMSLTAAIALLLFSLALPLLQVSRFVSAGQIFAAITFVLCYFNLIAHSYGVDYLFGAARHSSMTVTASALGILLSAGALALRPRGGLAGIVTGDGIGSILVRTLLPFSVLLPPALGALRLYGETAGYYDTRFGLTLMVIAAVGAFSTVILITGKRLNELDWRRAMAERDRQRGEFEYRTVIQSLPQMVWTAQANGECDFLNERWLAYTGAKLEELMGSGWLSAIHPDDIGPIVAQRGEAVRSGRVMDGEYRVRGANGEYRWFRALAVPLRDCSGAVTKWFGSSTDIHDQKMAAQEIMKWSQTLEQRVAERTEELANTQARLESILSAATQVSIIAVDNDFVIQVFNSGAEKMFGYSAEEMVGKATPAILLDPVELAEKRRKLPGGQTPSVSGLAEFLTPDGYAEARPWTKIRKDGTRVQVQMAVTPILNARGEKQGTLGISVDISERMAMEERLRAKASALQAARQEAEAANRAKSEFLANMSHEIRTPMNGVIGMTGLLLDTDLSEEQRQFTETIRRSGESLLVLLNDLLDFSRIEAGRMDLEVIDFDLRTMMDSTVRLVAVLAEQKGLELTCHIDSALPAVMNGDPGRLRQVLLNLAGNAVKFTSSGSVCIRAEYEPDDMTRVRFSVTDTGIGIPSERIGSLFQAFTQVDGSITRKFGGTGLGLAISKQLAALMGGTVGVESVLGQGSTFWVTAQIVKAEAVAPETAVESRGSLAGLRVLIVDDMPTNRQLLVNLLLGWGCLFEEAEGPQEALAALRRAAGRGTPFDTAIIDYRMPQLLGDELGRLINADPVCQSTRLILMTSVTMRGQAQIAAEAGFAGFLTKPVRQDDLREALILTAVRERRPGDATRRLITQHSIRESRQRRGRILLAEDNRTNQLVAVSMLRKMGYWVEAVANGAEAIAALKTAPYDLVLMDCQMPELDGLTATAMIRTGVAAVPNARIPIIAMTAFAMSGDRARCLAAGMDDYLAKPVSASELECALDRWMPRGEAIGRAENPADA